MQVETRLDLLFVFCIGTFTNTVAPDSLCHTNSDISKYIKRQVVAKTRSSSSGKKTRK